MSYRTSFNQNFLINRNLVESLVVNSSIAKTDTVYDIGAGQGIITHFLSLQAKKVIAVEPDTDLVLSLKEKFRDSKNINIIPADFLKLDLPHTPFKVFSNIPFNITTEIFHKLCFQTEYFTEGYFVVDKNILQKTMLFICIHNLFETQVVYNLSKSDFKPSPSVDTVLLYFKKKSQPDIKDFGLFNDFIAACFSTNQPDITSCLKKIFTPTQAIRLLKDNHIQSFSKHSQIPQNSWYNLFKFYEQNQSIVPTKIHGSFRIQYNNQSKLKKTNATSYSF